MCTYHIPGRMLPGRLCELHDIHVLIHGWAVFTSTHIKRILATILESLQDMPCIV
jgi:hypothetical protein